MPASGCATTSCRCVPPNSPAPTGTEDAGRQWILAELRVRLHKLSADNPQDIGLAETTGDALNIVVKRQDGVRFQNGVIQAYLGSRYLTAALRDGDFLEQALTRNHGPGRELLSALTLYTRSAGCSNGWTGGASLPATQEAAPPP